MNGNTFLLRCEDDFQNEQFQLATIAQALNIHYIQESTQMYQTGVSMFLQNSYCSEHNNFCRDLKDYSDGFAYSTLLMINSSHVVGMACFRMREADDESRYYVDIIKMLAWPPQKGLGRELLNKIEEIGLEINIFFSQKVILGFQLNPTPSSAPFWTNMGYSETQYGSNLYQKSLSFNFGFSMKGKKELEEFEGQKVGRWWEDIGKKATKWKVLKQNGPLLPEAYTPLPSRVKIRFDGRKITLDSSSTNNIFKVTAEEAALFYARRLLQVSLKSPEAAILKKLKDKVFEMNFFKDWSKILPKGALRSYIIKENKSSTSQSYNKIDFGPMVDFLIEEKEEKEKLSKEEKKVEREARKISLENRKRVYGNCLIDDVKYPCQYSIQPPGLFIGKITSKLRGKIKSRIVGKDVTLNVTKKFTPKCYSDGSECEWKKIVQEKSSTWLCKYTNNVTKSPVYTRLERSADPSVGKSDFIKFEKARALGRNIGAIRKKYRRDLSKKDTKQLAAAVYLLDRVAIRPGDDKEDDSDTKGLTTLTCGNIEFTGDNSFNLTFRGKSAIEFNREIEVDNADNKVIKVLKSLCKGKRLRQEIFPKVTATGLNKYLKSLDGKNSKLTAKVFRTWTASRLLSEKLTEQDVSPEDGPLQKKTAYITANLEAAVALNHKRIQDNEAKIEKIQANIDKAEEQKESKARTERLIKLGNDLRTAQENVSLTTTRINYMDPRITVSWAKRFEVPLEGGRGKGPPLMNPKMLQRFVWSMETPSTWEFDED